MGLIAVAICIAAAINLHGPMRVAAIILALINFSTLKRMAAEESAFENHPAAPVWNFLTTIGGLGLLVYSLVA